MAPPIMTPDELQARVLYRDGLVLIIDKPAGIPVHQGPGGGPNLEQGFDALRFGFPKPPALAHRLDRDTAGCLVLGRHPKALRRLGKLFSEGRAAKTYWAVTVGVPAEPQGRIEAPLLKISTRRDGWRMVVDETGQSAVTDYKVLGQADGLAWLELTPHTGRTHQIRVHCATALGCPLLGDPQYATVESDRPGAPMHLLSRAISLPLYPKRDPVGAVAPVPPHMAAALDKCGFTTEG